MRVNTLFEEHFKVRLQHHLVPTVCPVLSARISLIVSCHRTLAAEAEKQVQSLESEQRLKIHRQDSEGNSSEDRIERKTLSNQARDRHHEVVDELPTQRPRLENPASAIRWS